MKQIFFKNNAFIAVIFFFLISLWQINAQNPWKIKTGADQPDKYLPLLKGKNVGIITNQTGVVNTYNTNLPLKNTDHEKSSQYIHLIDFLVENNIVVKKIFAPEHGFRGKADAGEKINDEIDAKTGIPIISLYGNNKKPNAQQLNGLDIIIFDIQDVGARFYTYISSLHYMMEACAENNIPLLILDRPNPLGSTIDGPILNVEHQSFVGMHPIPILHGLTVCEYAQMINGEKWLKNGLQCTLKIIPCDDYQKNDNYILPIKPSPNLPNNQAIMWYPSLCLFEGTNVSVGRGTEKQFQIYGSPMLQNMSFTFTPQPNDGAKQPMHNGKKCFGENLENVLPTKGITLKYLINAYKNTRQKDTFFNSFFLKLAGTNQLKKQIIEGKSEHEIKKTWKKDLDDFAKTRQKYLIYKE